ncbi:MAG: AIM24 family protein [Intestinibacter sp.]|uniref:AIM24 family protein n=1 Tax=Intestinibacter sp. TaxID=1965304 RepID=UPI003F1635A7
MDLEKKTSVLGKYSHNNAEFEILSYDKLEGAQSVNMAQSIFFAKETGLKVKQVKITLNNSSIKTEAGALYYYKGNIESKTNIGGATGLFKKAVSGALTSESAIKPVYTGTGEIYLEPSFKHYIVMELDNDSIIVDKGLFFCCSAEINIKPVSQKNISSALLGGEGIFQMELSGTGIVVLESNVPESEIVEYDLTNGEVLKVDGNFAIARTSGVSFSVTKSDKSLFGSAINGEGLLNSFSGTGKVWLAPTAPMYNRLYSGIYFQNTSMNNEE